MERLKSTVWIRAFGIILIAISVYGLIAITILSVVLNTRVNYSLLSICVLPAILGIGIVRFNNIFRKITIGISVGLVVFAPLGYYLTQRADFRNLYLAGLPRRYQWILLALFGLVTAIYLTRREIKDQFISAKPRPK